VVGAEAGASASMVAVQEDLKAEVTVMRVTAMAREQGEKEWIARHMAARGTRSEVECELTRELGLP